MLTQGNHPDRDPGPGTDQRTGSTAGRGTPPRLVRSPVTLRDLTRHLLWPGLLQTPRLALAPVSLGACTLVALVLSLLDWFWPRSLGLPESWTGVVSEPLARAGAVLGTAYAELRAGLLSNAFESMTTLLLRVPADLAREYWPSILVVLLGMAGFAWATTVGARAAALRFGRHQHAPTGQTLALANERTRSVVAAWLTPLVIVYLGAAGLWLVGAMLRVGGLNVVTALLLPVPLALSVLVVLIATIGMIGALLAPGAAAADNADGFDIVQRTYAYVIARPLHMLVHLAVLAVVVSVAVGVAGAVVAAASRFWLLAADVRLADDAPMLTADGSVGQAGKLAHFWFGMLGVVMTGWTVSLIGSASAVFYLTTRRLVDGQLERELYAPGLISGTMVAADPAATAPSVTAAEKGAGAASTGSAEAGPTGGTT